MNVGTKHENEVELRVARGLDQVDNGKETWWDCQNRTEQLLGNLWLSQTVASACRIIG